MNEILMKRICYLIAINYAISKDTVWEIFEENNSIDETLRIVSNIQ